MAVNLHTTHFRFGIDELAENTHGWYANEDVSPGAGVIPLDTVFLLRVNVQETGGTAAGNVDNVFEFRINGGTWTALTTTSVGPRAVAAAALTNGGNCTKRLSGTGTFESTGAGQTEDGTSGGNANDIAASGCSETECGIIIDSADVSGNDTIEFRLTSPDFSITNDIIPTVVVPVTGYTLTADSGSYAHTGTAASLLVGWRVSAGSGAHVVTGTAATLAAGWRFTVEAGTFAWTGTAADLRKAFTVDGGVFVWTGTTSTLRSARRLSADAGTHAMTGVVARAILDNFPAGGGVGPTVVND